MIVGCNPESHITTWAANLKFNLFIRKDFFNNIRYMGYMIISRKVSTFQDVLSG
jgi:hypothetical protein